MNGSCILTSSGSGHLRHRAGHGLRGYPSPRI